MRRMLIIEGRNSIYLEVEIPEGDKRNQTINLYQNQVMAWSIWEVLRTHLPTEPDGKLTVTFCYKK